MLKTSTGYLYYLGPFTSKEDTDEWLIQAEDAGFKNPYIEKMNNGIVIEKLD
jgi:cell division septation protein DedD